MLKALDKKIQFRWNKKGSFGIAALPLYSPRRCLGAWPLGSQVSCMLMLLTRSIHFRWFSFQCKYSCEHNWNTLWEENKGGMNYLWIWISAFDTNNRYAYWWLLLTVFPHIRPVGIIISHSLQMWVLLENTTFSLHKIVRNAGIIWGRVLYFFNPTDGAHWDLLKILVWKFKYGNQLVFNKSGNQLVLVYM